MILNTKLQNLGKAWKMMLGVSEFRGCSSEEQRGYLKLLYLLLSRLPDVDRFH